jgi:hypothetical protein
MPSAPGSVLPQPESPTKEAAVAVDKENNVPRTPLTDTAVNRPNNIVAPVGSNTPRNLGELVPVPSTSPPTLESGYEPDEARKVNRVGAQHAQDAEEPPSESETVGSDSASSDLPVFDWEDLQCRYTKAIQAVNQEEEDILEEFYKYSDVSLQIYGILKFVMITFVGFLCLGRGISKS